jgi:hypothetical protein
MNAGADSDGNENGFKRARQSAVATGRRPANRSQTLKNMRSIQKRLMHLERRLQCDPIVLEMPDGSEKTITVSSADGVVALFGRSMQELEAWVGFSRDVDAIRRSIGGTEKGGYMIELCRALLNSPVTAEEEASQV